MARHIGSVISSTARIAMLAGVNPACILPQSPADVLESEAGFENQVAKAIAAKKTGAALAEGIKDLFKQELDREWRDHIEAEAKRCST